MLGFLNVLILVIFQNIIVECKIPDLKVKKIDNKVILRKRLDTLEMCRLFNAENNRLKSSLPTKPRQFNDRRRRVKRSLDVEDDARRVEEIVDKLYDDLSEKGEKVKYRRRIFTGPTATSAQQSGRRLNFAPALLLPPNINGTESINQPPKPVPPAYKWFKKWSDGIIPYFVDPKTYDSQLIDTIMSAFDYFEKATCIRLHRLREKPVDKKSLQEVEWIYISNPTGIRQCVHSNERFENKGVQLIIFGYDCMSQGEIIHEVMHILGFGHEHNRYDRDQYVQVHWENIKPGYKRYFEIKEKHDIQTIPYDYDSVLHYPPRAFSKNGKVTLSATNGKKFGQRSELSDRDVEKVRFIFGSQCVDRDKKYLLSTCPTVLKPQTPKVEVTKEDIDDYFKDKIWPEGEVPFALRDSLEFSTDEMENIRAVIHHIQKETCIIFRDKGVVNTEGIKQNLEETTTEETTPEETTPEETTPEETTTEGIVQYEEKSRDNEQRRKMNEIPSEPKKHIKKAKHLANAKSSKSAMKQPLSIDDLKPNTRRHSRTKIVLTRSPKPGCTCPTHEGPDDEIIELGTDCFNSANDLLHVFVHILGLDHQHNMHDRDDYLHIEWEKLTPELKKDLENKLPPEASLGFPYDYKSVMHYPWLQIKNGVSTILYPVWNDGWVMGHWQGLSVTDAKKLQLLYKDECAIRKKKEDKELQANL